MINLNLIDSVTSVPLAMIVLDEEECENIYSRIHSDDNLYRDVINLVSTAIMHEKGWEVHRVDIMKPAHNAVELGLRLIKMSEGALVSESRRYDLVKINLFSKDEIGFSHKS